MFPFSSKKTEPDAGPSDVEVIRAKIAACDAEISKGEEELHRVSLVAALSDDPDAGKDAIAKLTDLRTRKDLLCDALSAAQEVERENAHRLSEREFQARRRSLAQKIGQLNRDAAALTEALAATRDAFRRMASTAGGIDALLPAHLRTGASSFEHLLSASHIRTLTEIEAARLAEGGIASPGARPVLIARNDDGQITPLTRTISDLADGVRTAFERCGPVQPTEREPSAQEVTA